MAHGTVRWFSTRKGFGFITRAGFVSRDAGGTDVFFHHSQLAGSSRPGTGDLMRFALERHPGGLRAVDVRAVAARAVDVRAVRPSGV